MIGAGVLDPLVCDPDVTDVLVNGPDEVWLDRGDGLERVPIDLGGAEAVRRLAQRLAADCGRRLDDAHPYVDARLADGSRLHAVLPPVAVGGPYLSLRMFRSRAFTLRELTGAGTLTEASAELLAALVTARLALLVTGGTGSGKTTLLSALLGLVPHTERIVIVEDAAELRPDHPHVLTLEARAANVEGAGRVGLRDLVRQALRMRPDRIIVGECRGAEVAELLTALNTGHDGGAGTVHANSAADVPARLEALALPHGLDRAGLHAQVAAALRMVLHLRRTPSGRVLHEVSLLRLAPDGQSVRVVPAWRRDGGAVPAAPEVARLLRARGVAVPAVLEEGRC
ncbi:hypothetical protein Afil01_52600 [Actinorhabdospora filicis]|uniref:Bacterial type II secretion system protein E domain-containing protein n=1 Tax=Actinorhabdospora filicis TaxID=1785913 RepID=A0A9W6WBV1_9ACTN|nr:hypothetical protein Afil01_52600 [Actinorhabdospora filicis]